MKRYKISTFLGEAFKGIYRNPLSSVVSVISLIMALLVMGTFWMLKVNIDLTLDSMDNYRKIVEQAWLPIFVKDTLDTDILLKGCALAGLNVIEYTLRREDAAWVRRLVVSR